MKAIFAVGCIASLIGMLYGLGMSNINHICFSGFIMIYSLMNYNHEELKK